MIALNDDEVDGLIDVIEGSLDSMEDWQDPHGDDIKFWIRILNKFNTPRADELIDQLKKSLPNR